MQLRFQIFVKYLCHTSMLALAGRRLDHAASKSDFAGCSSQQLLSIHSELVAGMSTHAEIVSGGSSVAEQTYHCNRTGSERPLIISREINKTESTNGILPYFHVDMLEVDNHTLSNLHMAKPYRPELITVDLQRTQTSVDVVDDIIYYRSAYFGVLSVGTPAQDLTVVFDTGSGNLILPSSYCHTPSCKVHKRYRRSASSSARDVDGDGGTVKPDDPRDELTVSFGTGEVTGVFVDDRVCFGSGEAGKSSCVSMQFIAATEMSEDPFKDFTFDGVLGLGLPTLSHASAFSFLEAVSVLTKKQGGSHDKTFALFLGNHEEETSKLTFGGWDDQHLEDPRVQWSSVLDPELGHWMLEIKSLSVDGKILPFCEEGCKAVVDSGTSLLGVPSEIFPELYELLNHAASLEGECSSQSPHLEITLEGLTVTLDGEDFAYLEEHQASNVTQEWGAGHTWFQDKARDDMTCSPMLMTIDLPEPIGPKLFILGEPVLRKYYTIYDAEKKRIGLGLAQHKPKQQGAFGDEDEENWFEEAEEEAVLEDEKVLRQDERKTESEERTTESKDVRNKTERTTESEEKAAGKKQSSQSPAVAMAALIGLLATGFYTSRTSLHSSVNTHSL